MPRVGYPVSVRILMALGVAAALSSTPKSEAQLAHHGPEKVIALAATLPPYDVVSVKQNNTGEQSYSMSIHDDVFTAKNVPLEQIVEFAYDVKADLVRGLSGPVKSVNFDVDAKVLPGDDGKPRKLTDTQLQAMILSLLADRFQLKAHLESKTVPTYDLVVVQGGPRFKLSQDSDKNSGINMGTSNDDDELNATSASMLDLAQALSDLVHRPVADKTGLTGTADLVLKWTSDEAAEQGGTVVSIFTALQEQLGLKLQPSHGEAQVLVIDHAEMPTPN